MRKGRGRERKRENENGVSEKKMGGRKEERGKGRSVRPEARLHVRVCAQWTSHAIP